MLKKRPAICLAASIGFTLIVLTPMAAMAGDAPVSVAPSSAPPAASAPKATKSKKVAKVAKVVTLKKKTA